MDVDAVVEDLVANAARSPRRDRSTELADYVANRPGLLTPHLARLLEARILQTPTLYRHADDTVRTRLVEMIESTQYSNAHELLRALAHADGPIAEDAFLRWTRSPPPALRASSRDVSAYALEGGFAIRRDSTVVSLCGRDAIAIEQDGHDALASGGALDARCPQCDRALWSLLDVATADTRVAAALAHTGWHGRLRIATCVWCSAYGTVFSEVSVNGDSSWSAETHQPPFIDRDTTGTPLPRSLHLGESRKTPFAASPWHSGGSTLGGRPEWIFDAEHLRCPRCADWMHYIALIGGADLDEYGEGAYYVHLHAPCGLATVNYQQS